MARTTGFTNGAVGTQIWLDNVQCTGTETSLFGCQANPLGNENCNHAEDAGVSCLDGKVEGGTNPTMMLPCITYPTMMLPCITYPTMMLPCITYP
jgi:hypothetical protein